MSADVSNPELSRSLSRSTESDRSPSRSITCAASASPVEIRVPPRKVSDHGLSSRAGASSLVEPPPLRSRAVEAWPGLEEAQERPSSSLRVSGRQHLVGAVGEDDEADAALRLRERAQHALRALGLLRVDARREVEHDDAAARRREVARRQRVEARARRERRREEREHALRPRAACASGCAGGRRELVAPPRSAGPACGAIESDAHRRTVLGAAGELPTSPEVEPPATTRARGPRPPAPAVDRPRARARPARAPPPAGTSPFSEPAREHESARSSGVRSGRPAPARRRLTGSTSQRRRASRTAAAASARPRERERDGEPRAARSAGTRGAPSRSRASGCARRPPRDAAADLERRPVEGPEGVAGPSLNRYLTKPASNWRRHAARRSQPPRRHRSGKWNTTPRCPR